MHAGGRWGERRKEPGAWTKGGGGLESEGRGKTSYFGLKNTLGAEQRGRGTSNERPGI